MQDLQPEETCVVSSRSVEEMRPAAEGIERDPHTLPKLYAAQKRLDAARDLDEVLLSICDGVLLLLPRATRVTVTLRGDDDGREEAVFEPMLTRVRDADGQGANHAGPIPIARSVFRKVPRE